MSTFSLAAHATGNPTKLQIWGSEEMPSPPAPLARQRRIQRLPPRILKAEKLSEAAPQIGRSSKPDSEDKPREPRRQALEHEM
jgi:hypothetical protein